MRLAIPSSAFVFALLSGLSGAPLPADAEIEISVYGGQQTSHPSTIRSSSLGDDRVNWNSESFKIPVYYGLRAKRWSEGRLGFGIDFFHAKAIADGPEKYGYQNLNFSHGLNVLTADIWYRFDTLGRVTPYVGAGLGVAIPHVEVQPIGGQPTAEYQIAGPAATVVIGGALAVGGKWSVFTEYQAAYSQIRARLDSGNRLRTEIFTDALNVGVSLRF